MVGVVGRLSPCTHFNSLLDPSQNRKKKKEIKQAQNKKEYKSRSKKENIKGKFEYRSPYS